MSASRSGRNPLDVVFLWHFHQPYYGVPDADEFFLPWVRLHAVKSYYDMARMLEEWPAIRATFNFSGSLLQQIVEYVDDGKRDRWWRWSKKAPATLSLAERRGMVRNFFSLDVARKITPLSRYQDLYDRRQEMGVASLAESLSDQELLDLQVLFNLCWCGFGARDDFPLIDELLSQGQGFDERARNALLDIHIEVMSQLLPLYRKLIDRDQIEVSVSPMYHPIIPLVIDTEVAARPSPQRPRPTPYRAPEDAAAHIQQALELAESTLGVRPQGIWPSEGSVSPEASALFAEAGVQWIATDEEVLCRSRGDQWDRHRDLWRPWRLGDKPAPRIFFRDRGLSDRIGFSYAKVGAGDAADDLVGDLIEIGADLQADKGCVSIILDGENPWEHYRDDGRPFLDALYARLSAAEELRSNTPSRIAAELTSRLDHLHSGSWIMANFNIWIGHEQTNQAWEWLRKADEFLARTTARSPSHPNLDRAREHLRIAQGSDWFWWYGDDFSSEQDDQFDALFRALVAGVWSTLDVPAPDQLAHPIGKAPTQANALQITVPQRFISPTIDGKIGGYFDWNRAGQITVSGGHGSMFESFRPLASILYGFSPLHFFLCLKPGEDFSAKCRFQIHIEHRDRSHQIPLARGDTAIDDDALAGTAIAFDEVAELSIPLHMLGLSAGDHFELAIDIERDGLQLRRFPSHDAYRLEVPKIDPGLEYWIV